MLRSVAAGADSGDLEQINAVATPLLAHGIAVALGGCLHPHPPDRVNQLAQVEEREGGERLVRASCLEVTRLRWVDGALQEPDLDGALDRRAA